ncbi:hypothetical protein [Desulfoscipio geothermicus]|uniref:Uncharacterized protein n=1 Tax=Desulfoscipio geothermicus DSM 3669 TaxID=1121426 RepID=A0A1I6D2X8_9FIRM|nr:hypothetical protein [Desulfoscipio geothermicus]SFQ99805.1 hypothetical protein SAMN05660706_104175 [Desulfoscipio geothermicus DSM 3669]
MTKTIILMIIIYLVLTKIMNRDGRDRSPRTTIPGSNRTGRDPSPAGPRGVPERGTDDAPLAGPWNRMPGPEADVPLPGPWNKFPAPEEADMPLPGPWDRGPVDAGRDTDRGRVDRDREPEPMPEKRQPCENTGLGTGRRDPDEVKPFEEGPRRLPDRAAVSKLDKKTGDAKGAVSESACRERKRCRSRNPLAAVLNDRSALAGSMVLGEVIGSRGGRRRK